MRVAPVSVSAAPSVPAAAAAATASPISVPAAPMMDEPVGWSPVDIDPTVSSRAPGLLRGGVAAWRGVPELAPGTALSSAQIAVLAPFLAGQFGLSPGVVLGDLQRVRIQIGGLAAGNANVATTVGINIYVSDAAHAAQILSWRSRTWLVHELAHTMQWRAGGMALSSDADRDHAFLSRYVGAFAMSGGRFGAGGFARAGAEAWRRMRSGERLGPLGDLLHDTHPLEAEAIRVARVFSTLTARV